MTRRELRESIFLLLFRREFHSLKDMEEQFDLFTDDYKEYDQPDEEGLVLMTEQDKEFIRGRVFDILPRISELDAAIDSVAEGWKTARMSRVDLTILRLACYEIKHIEDVPGAVAINEAVELAKKYGGNESSSFVNGILAKLV